MGDDVKACGGCRHWRPDGGDVEAGLAISSGECRRNAPTLAVLCLKPDADGHWDGGDIRNCTCWPGTWHDDWCGEWQPRPAEVRS